MLSRAASYLKCMVLSQTHWMQWLACCMQESIQERVAGLMLPIMAVISHAYCMHIMSVIVHAYRMPGTVN